MSLPRPVLRLTTVAMATVAATLALLGVGAGIASAHVSVSSPNATEGGYGTVVFTVPNETKTANTTRVQVQIPDATPLAQVLVQPLPGWTVTTTQRQLAQPLPDDDGGSVSTVVSVVDFTATAGGIAPGQFQQFTLSAGAFPDDKASFAFNVLQTYSDGTQAAWIDPTVAGQPEPEHPAPVLRLVSAGGTVAAAPAASGHSHGGAATATSSDAPPTGLTLFLALLALAVAVAAVVLAVLTRRRTVAS